MTPERQVTIRRLAVSGVAFAASAVAFIAWVVWLLVIEGQAVAQGGDSTISRVVWGAWASEPGAILLIVCVLWAVVCTVVGITAFLCGHFFWQRSATYDAIRRGEIGAARVVCVMGVGLLALLFLGAKAPDPAVKLIVSPRNGFALPTKPLRVHAVALSQGLECPSFEWDCGNDSERGSHVSDCNDPSDSRDCTFKEPGDFTVSVRASDSSAVRVATLVVLVR